MEVEINGSVFVFSRSTSSDSQVTIAGDISDWPIDTSDEQLVVKVEEFRRVLGMKVFGLDFEAGKTGQLMFRTLASYFMRTDPTAFVDPFKFVSNQKAISTQMANAFLLGLNNEYSFKFAEIDKKKKLLGDLEKAATAGMLDDFTGSLGDLEAKKVRLKQRLDQLSSDVSSFRVHDEYYAIQDEANELTQDIHTLLNEITVYEQTVTQYEKSITQEKDITSEEVANIYKEAGVYFSGELKQRLADVQAFHKAVVTNRHEYLTTEIERIKGVVSSKKQTVGSLSIKKESTMGVLNSHGALDEFSQLQNRVASVKQQYDDVNSRIDKINDFRNGMSKLSIEIQELVQAMRQDYKERQAFIDEAIAIFNNNSEVLYSEPGTLSIDIGNNGYKFDVNILRASSGGVSNMKVFCYDLLIAEIASRLKGRPMPLIHDSRIFDGVDERQIAKALKLAYSKSKECGFQYICTINSDDVPMNLFDDDFKKIFEDSIVLRYSDSDPKDTLLGFRF